MEQLSGYIEHIIYSNATNGYTVFELATDTGKETCVGILHAVDEGENIKVSGEYTNHPSYGRQFSIKEYKIIESTDEMSIRRYLSSGAIKGVGPALATRIVDEFGEDTFRVMEEEPELLARIKGISAKKAMEIAAVVIEKHDLRKVMVYLQKYGISNNLAMKIYAKYGMAVYKVMEENPYTLAEDIDGVGFKTADHIASISGIAIDSAYRIKSGILYTISYGIAYGHTYIPKDLLINWAKELLEIQPDDIWMQAENLAIEKKLIIKCVNDEVRVYSNAFYYMELGCASMLRDLDILIDPRESLIIDKIKSFDDSDNTLDELQLNAVAMAVSHGVSIITGGPGTGKTTTINRIIKYLISNGDDFLLAAPTGRAAKRMREATGYEAFTIQRMLGLGASLASEKGYSYERNEDNPLEVDAIIIDEMSMVDLPLFNALLKAVLPGTILVLVGDTNQLPSVGPGSVLKDIISSECFPMIRLEKIFRQDEESDIIINAHKINDGIIPVTDNKSKDFFFLERNDVNVILNNMVKLVSDKLPRYVGSNSFDVQVLTPMRRGVLGVENLNPVLQKYLNPPDIAKKEKEFGNTIFREGDKVMQIKNNYQLEWEIRGKYGIPLDKGVGVFNGDMGIVKEIDNTSEIIEVEYEDNHLIKYPFANLDELELAYAVTIHKSQGSEYPAVVIPLLGGPKPLLNRNILYTAITRAKSCVTLLGSKSTFEQMVENADETKRYTSLGESIKDVMNNII